MRGEGVFGSAELVPLTPKLGQYFGTEKGLLVVRAPADSRLKLEDGDVIVDIDGRTPASPSHAFRILGSYQPGEKLKLNVLRMKKRMTFEITIPETAARGERASTVAHFERRFGTRPGAGPCVMRRALRAPMPGDDPAFALKSTGCRRPRRGCVPLAGRARALVCTVRAHAAQPTSPTTFLDDLIAQQPPIERAGSRLAAFASARRAVARSAVH